jgi:copper chaperone
MAIRIYDVPGISCGHCKASIEGALSDVEGMEAIEVDVDARTVRVKGYAPDEAIRAALDDAGYDVAGCEEVAV